MTLNDAQNAIGRKVIYTPFLGCDPNMTEVGVITSVNDKFVFVRYGSDVNSKATRAEDLQFEGE